MQVELSVGTVLNGRFQIDKVLGVGGFGITYLGHHKDLGYKCAVKEYFISGKCVRQSDGLSIGYQGISEEQFSKYKGRFLDEARTLVKVKNRHVVSVLDVFEANNTAYIVMEFIEGVNLQEKVRKQGPLEYTLAVNYIAQLSEAVECCHQRHILHRDIKPDNVMITPDDRVVLIDFGSARDFVNDEVQRHTAILTQGYAPIEQYTSTSKKGNYTDIYSLGGVFYYAVTGHKPMDATDRMLSEMPTPKSFNSAIPDAAENTIMKAMQMKPEDRYQNVGEFMDDLVGKINTAEAPNIPDLSIKQTDNSPSKKEIEQIDHSQSAKYNGKASKKGLLIGLIIAAVVLLVGGLAWWMYDKAFTERGIKIQMEMSKSCDKYISEMNERNILDKLDITVDELRKLENFENKSPFTPILKRKLAPEKMKMFIGKLTGIKTNLETDLYTTYKNYDKEGIIYRITIRKINRIDEILNDFNNSKSKSANDIHMQGDEF